MRIHPFLQTGLILLVIGVITYSLADGIRYGNRLAVILALGSLTALFVAIYLSRKLTAVEQEEEELFD